MIRRFSFSYGIGFITLLIRKGISVGKKEELKKSQPVQSSKKRTFAKLRLRVIDRKIKKLNKEYNKLLEKEETDERFYIVHDDLDYYGKLYSEVEDRIEGLI